MSRFWQHTDKHVEGVVVLEARNHGGDEGVAGNGGQDIALVAHMLDLLEANDWRCVRAQAETLRGREQTYHRPCGGS